MTQSAPSTDHKEHESHTLHYLALGGALISGAVVLAPYVLPNIGIGDSDTALTVLNGVCGSETGTGIAGAMNQAMQDIPIIGAPLSNGGIYTAATVGVIGIGGTYLGKALEKDHVPDEGFNWGKAIRYAAVTTSALIALPSLLTGISMGLVYLAYAYSGRDAASDMIGMVSDTIGSIGKTAANNSGLSGGMALIPHLLTCGASFFPAIGSYFINEDDKEAPTQPSFAERELQRREASAQQEAASPTTVTSTEMAGIRADMVTDAPPRAGIPCHANLILRHSDTGKPLTPEEIAVVHTERIHLLLIDDTLNDYHHLHPQPTSQAGIYQFDYTPSKDGHYSAWIDLTRSDTQHNPYIRCDMPSTQPATAELPYVPEATTAQADGLSFQWTNREPLQQGKASIVDVSITDNSGKPITDLEPIMGAYAHLIGFSADGSSLVHSHPMGTEPTSNTEHGSSPLTFHIEPDRSGNTKFFLQVQRHGHVTCVPFGQTVRSIERNTIPQPETTHAAMIAHQHMYTQNHSHHAP